MRDIETRGDINYIHGQLDMAQVIVVDVLKTLKSMLGVSVEMSALDLKRPKDDPERDDIVVLAKNLETARLHLEDRFGT